MVLRLDILKILLGVFLVPLDSFNIQQDRLLSLLDNIKNMRVHIKTRPGKLPAVPDNIKNMRVHIKTKPSMLLALPDNIKSTGDHNKIQQNILLSVLRNWILLLNNLHLQAVTIPIT